MDIISWQPMLLRGNLVVPTLSFTPSIESLDHIRRNNYYVTIIITGTETPIDGLPVNGTVAEKCRLYKTCIPNFDSTPPIYCISLEYPWYGYPLSLKKASFKVVT